MPKIVLFFYYFTFIQHLQCNLKPVKIGSNELMPEKILMEQDPEWSIEEKQCSREYDFINKSNCFLQCFFFFPICMPKCTDAIVNPAVSSKGIKQPMYQRDKRMIGSWKWQWISPTQRPQCSEQGVPGASRITATEVAASFYILLFS